MTETSNAQSLGPTFETLDSCKTKEENSDLNHGESRSASDTTLIEEVLCLLSVEEKSWDTRKPEIQFDLTQCLFCNFCSTDLDDNLEHMLKRHGLFIPDRCHLIVDIETLLEYFHLVISGYFECLYCGSQRSSAQAAQQHMIGKGHCKIDIRSQDSEFRDFYDFESTFDDTDSENIESLSERSGAAFVNIDKSMRLPSGKVLSHRTQGKPRLHRHGITSKETPSASSILRSTSTLDISRPQPNSTSDQVAPSESKRIVKREAAFAGQLASLRADDRRCLMHFPLWKQRALVFRSKKEVEQARRRENDMLLKIQLKANRSSKK